VSAVSVFLESGKPKGSISFLITNDEEGVAVNGTQKMLEWITQQGERIDACVVGEPTNPVVLGEMIKVGRRGSITCTLMVRGKQGHVAYPDLADNPVTRLVNMLHALKAKPLDQGTEYFPPSNLEVTSVDVGNPTVNVIPALAVAKFNIRFNNLHNSALIEQWIHETCKAVGGQYELQSRVSGEAFLTENEALANVLVSAVQRVTGRKPVLSTTGGTSDARFIKNYCPVMEFGTTGRTPHMVDENVSLETLVQLRDVYVEMLRGYFG
jgi:succinyl-diaminopimelate desuccinylase